MRVYATPRVGGAVTYHRRRRTVCLCITFCYRAKSINTQDDSGEGTKTDANDRHSSLLRLCVCSPAPHTVMPAGEVGRYVTGLCQVTRPDRRLFLRSGTSNGFRSARTLVSCRRPNFDAETCAMQTEPQTLLLFSPSTQWEPLTSSTHEADVVDGGTS